MAILIDTQALVWIGVGSERLSPAVAAVIKSNGFEIFVSAVTAYEFTDLNNQGRFEANLPLPDLLARLDATVLDFPADCWMIAAMLPTLHRDPVDRMLIAHAIHAGLTLVTADETMRRYPVRTLW